MDWYLMVWRRYAEFAGRSRRKEYWMFVLFNFLAVTALIVIGGLGVAFIDNGSGIGGILFVPLGIYFLAAFIPSLAVAVRRFHDTGKSGWLLLVFMLVGMIPFIGIVGAIIQIVFMCQDSDPGTNQYGPNPKNPELSGVAAGTAGFTSMGLGAQAQPFTGGNPLVYCRTCGKQMESGSQFCSGCGTHL